MPFVKLSCSLSRPEEFLYPPSCPETIPFKVIIQEAKKGRGGKKAEAKAGENFGGQGIGVWMCLNELA